MQREHITFNEKADFEQRKRKNIVSCMAENRESLGIKEHRIVYVMLYSILYVHYINQ